MFEGVNASDGIGIGHATVAVEPDLDYTPAPHSDTDEEEIARYKKALEAFCEKTEAQAARMAETVGEAEAAIMSGHVTMANDPFMVDEINNRITDGKCAEQALDEVCDMFRDMFAASDEQLIRERVADVEDIRTGVLAQLLGKEVVDLSALPEGSIVVVSDLTPSMTATIDKKNVAGIVTETGGRTSHSAIIARALEIPAVLSMKDACSIIKNGDTCIIDGTKGQVIVDPSQDELAQYQALAEQEAQEKAALEAYRGKETKTADGTSVMLCANIGNPDDANAAVEHDAEGVGLFRSEFLFMDSQELPTEEEQFSAYQKVALRMQGNQVIIRTLDVGGDKEIPYLNMVTEENPFLGFRAIRYCLQNPEQYKVQLRALLRASAFGDIKIMLPLVTCVDEVREAKKLVKECMAELDKEGIDYNKNIEVGTMIETPAASLIADELAQECDFFSIGTNDLIGYTMCADRGNDRVRYLYQVYNPAVLRSLQRIISAANEAGIMVGMCGEAAADPLLIPMLISFGLNEYSVSAPSILKTRKVISQWSKQEADELAEKVMKLKTAKEVKEALAAAVK